MTHLGPAPALTDGDVVMPALEAERMFHATCLGPHTARTIRKLADLSPTTLAIMSAARPRGPPPCYASDS